MAASNTQECIEEMIGHTIKGVIFTTRESKFEKGPYRVTTLVFEDDTGWSIGSNGSFWRESKNEIHKLTYIEKRRLEKTKGRLEKVLRLAGELDD